MHRDCCEWKLGDQQKEVNPQIMLIRRFGFTRQKEQVGSTTYAGKGEACVCTCVCALLRFMGTGAEKWHPGSQQSSASMVAPRNIFMEDYDSYKSCGSIQVV